MPSHQTAYKHESVITCIFNMKLFISCLLITFTQNVISFEYDYLWDTDKVEQLRVLYPNYEEVYEPHVTSNIFHQETPIVLNQETPFVFRQEDPYVFSEETPNVFNTETANAFTGEEVKPTTDKAENNDANNKLPVQNDFNVKTEQSNYDTLIKSSTESTGTVETSTQQASSKPFYDIKDGPELFKKFIKDYDKQYKDDNDYKIHFENFVENLKKINKLNKEEDGTTFDINLFADLGEGESILG
ncbi:hypothetical protein MSG28_004164 [Choristoneura fumiferana]|uniref:Uncharacterized protein n=1 Tax=Choristoneura fumiferana TaxID=7141 RepID=A0ACC0KIX0_CHOFU|nr:hypothetical protein MSG28_004164 [Choristoneura fumiferana]